MTRSSSRWSGLANITPPVTLDGSYHDVDAEDVDGAPQIIGERGEAERGADIVEAPYQEGALVHPLLKYPEGMFDGLTALRESVQQSGDPVQHYLIVQTRDLAAGSPWRPAKDRQGTPSDCCNRIFFKSRSLPSWYGARVSPAVRTDGHNQGRIVAGLVLGEETIVHR